ncbi:MAG: hypothetical protein U5L98_08035 [Halomonas sp.]|nr:hypothetical protein [Halomonas sp.]MDZ7852582.1 hypothetical protein [Halomonas sp.]
MTELPPLEELTAVAQAYVERTPGELGAQNVVTAVIVTMTAGWIPSAR